MNQSETDLGIVNESQLLRLGINTFSLPVMIYKPAGAMPRMFQQLGFGHG
jgi:hypothetical protein